jgi:hypothetical protein
MIPNIFLMEFLLLPRPTLPIDLDCGSMSSGNTVFPTRNKGVKSLLGYIKDIFKNQLTKLAI